MIYQVPFGTLSDHTSVPLYIIERGKLRLSVCPYGARIVAISMLQLGEWTELCLSHTCAKEYETDTYYLGATIGRCANRINGTPFQVSQTLLSLPVNEGSVHLHGGSRGFDRHVFCAQRVSEFSMQFSILSSDGDQGYPGDVNLCVTYSICEDQTISIEYTGASTKDTILNCTNHTYFTLGTDHPEKLLLTVHSDTYTPVDKLGLPLGSVATVCDTPLDLREGVPLEQLQTSTSPILTSRGGIDHNFLAPPIGPTAVLRAPDTGICLTLTTDQPCLQVYGGQYLSDPFTASCAIALEPQGFPDAVHQPNFPAVMLPAGVVYNKKILYKITDEVVL